MLSILTMTIGNLVALQQRQVVRLLAYSSIAQAGYMLLPFALVSANPAINQDAFAAAVTLHPDLRGDERWARSRW